MKRQLVLFFFLCLLAGGYLSSRSQSKSTLFGFHSEVSRAVPFSKMALQQIKISLPSFSYGASLEKRFSIHKKLNFSLQYSLTYHHRLQLSRIKTNFYLQQNKNQVSSQVELKTFAPLNKKIRLYSGAGFTVNHEAFNFNKRNLLSESTFKTPSISLNYLFGLERKIRLFNKDLYYSIQYNVGFYPASKQLRISDIEPEYPMYFHGIRLGLKYKY